ncbi:MAG: hypothetical protein EPN25_00820 [Nitrospirae bacterium]|nr:MAG: hypothetical protein EPN25_00820 [Nitrospirota bacterium]
MKRMMHLASLLLLMAAPAFGSEQCVGQYSGTCRDVCRADEEAADGAFVDCAEKQECCVPKAVPKEKQEKDPSAGKKGT